MSNKVEVNQGLEGVVVAETQLSHVDGQLGQLVIRGLDIEEIIHKSNYESLVYLLWHGAFPDQKALQDFSRALSQARALTPVQKKVLQALPQDVNTMAGLRTLVSALEPTQEWPPSLEDGLMLVAKMPTMVAALYHHRRGQAPIEPREDLGHTANYLYMIHGREFGEAEVRALDTYLMLGADHGMNCSTFTTRVVTSTESDLISAVTAGIGALKGPLHGGAPSIVDDMLDAVGTIDNVEPYLRSQLDAGKRLMGFGHRVYRTYDPRAAALREVAEKLPTTNAKIELSRALEKKAIELLQEYKPGRNLYPNVEFWAAAVLRSVDLPRELYPPTFAVSRSAGWVAHIVEQSQNNRLMRPSGLYTSTIPPLARLGESE